MMKNSDLSLKLKSFVRSFTPYQIGYLVTVLLLTAAFAILFPELMLEDVSNQFVCLFSVAVLANPVCELMISKQSSDFLVDFPLLRSRSW